MTPWKSASCPMGSSTGATPAPKVARISARVRSKSARSRSSLLMTMTRGHAEAGRGAPGVLGLGLHAVGGADDDDGQVDVGQGGDHLAGEVGVPGGVEQVHLDPVDREGGQAGRDGQLARHLLGLEVHDGGALLHRPPSGDGPRGGQQRLGQGGLAGTVVPDEGDVANCGRVVWHLVPPSSVRQPALNWLVDAECTTARRGAARASPVRAWGRRRSARPGAGRRRPGPPPGPPIAASYSWRMEKRTKRPSVSTRSSHTALSEIVLPNRSSIAHRRLHDPRVAEAPGQHQELEVEREAALAQQGQDVGDDLAVHQLDPDLGVLDVQPEQQVDEALVAPRVQPPQRRVVHRGVRVPLAADDDVGLLGAHDGDEGGQELGGDVAVGVDEAEVPPPPHAEPRPQRVALADVGVERDRAARRSRGSPRG